MLGMSVVVCLLIGYCTFQLVYAIAQVIDWVRCLRRHPRVQ